MAIASPVEGTAFRMDGLPPKESLPTQYDLPSEDPEEPGVPDEFHSFQPQLLRETFKPAACAPDQVFIASDINLYYDPAHPLWHKRPDWLAVLGKAPASRQEELRLSYVVWQEELVPYVVIELLSPGTEDEDQGRRLWDLDKTPGKWFVYERILKIPYYILYSRYTGRLQAFGRVSASYRPILLQEGRLWLPEAGIGLGLWEGTYAGCTGRWLRWLDGDGHWIPTPLEAERARAEEERDRADQERARAERLAERLRALGLDPEAL
jgi:Uma2 family endonuclease